jgi:hypothetical protein
MMKKLPVKVCTGNSVFWGRGCYSRFLAKIENMKKIKAES